MIYTYAKDGKIICREYEDARYIHNEILKEGYKHTETTDPCAFLEHLHNECTDEEIIKQIRELGK